MESLYTQVGSHPSGAERLVTWSVVLPELSGLESRKVVCSGLSDAQSRSIDGVLLNQAASNVKSYGIGSQGEAADR